MLGNSDDVNRANAQTAEEVHISWHEVPRLRRLKVVANRMYMPMFGLTADQREMDFVDPTPTSSNDANDELTAKSTALQLLVAAGFDPEEACIVVGLPVMKYVGVPGIAAAAGEANTGPGKTATGGNSQTPGRRAVGPSNHRALPAVDDDLDMDLDMAMNVASLIKSVYGPPEEIWAANGHGRS